MTKEAGRPVLTHERAHERRCRLVPFAEAQPVGANQQRQVRPRRRRLSERPMQECWSRRRREQIPPVDGERNPERTDTAGRAPPARCASPGASPGPRGLEGMAPVQHGKKEAPDDVAVTCSEFRDHSLREFLPRPPRRPAADARTPNTPIAVRSAALLDALDRRGPGSRGSAPRRSAKARQTLALLSSVGTGHCASSLRSRAQCASSRRSGAGRTGRATALPGRGPASAREGIPGRAGKRDQPGAGQRDDDDAHAVAVPVGVAASANSDGVR